MAEGFDDERDLFAVLVPRVGAVTAHDDLWEPVRLIDAAGEPVVAVMSFLKELQASGRSVGTLRSCVPGRLARSARRLTLHLPQRWPCEPPPKPWRHGL